MTFIIAGTFLILLALLAFTIKTNTIYEIIAEQEKALADDDEGLAAAEIRTEEAALTRGWLFAAVGIALIAFLAAVYYGFIEGTPVEGHFKEWLNLIVRWVHITFGIAWIGASFYFVFLENALNRTKNVRDELAGNLWAVHGGGFYYLEKYKLAPKEIPRELHWFKYEAYFTWLSGFCLLAVVYYLNAKAFLIDPNVLDITPIQGIGIGIGTLIAGWIVYDLLCRSPLAKNTVVFAIVGFLIMTGFAYFLTQVFNSRAAYIHVGALIGTIMAANVFFTIIPAQKAMVNAAKEGRPLDPRLGKNAGLRSLHNNYFTLPVLFIMISNHFPSTFGHEYHWAVLAGISLASATFKHYLNLTERGEKSVWVLPIAIVMMLSIAFITAPSIETGKCDSNVSYTRVHSIIQERCTTCHSSSPTDKVWTSPPNGVVYDTPQDVVKMADKIMQRVVITKNMPQNNQTGMLPEERELIRCWIEQGMKLE